MLFRSQVNVVYDFTYPSHNGLFTQNGVSSLSGISGLQVMATAAPGAICTGDAVQLHADVGTASGVAFTWSSQPVGFSSDQQNPVDHPAENTIYYVHAFDGVFHAYDTVNVTVTQVNPLVDILPLKNITIPAGQFSCYNALQTITVAGDGTTFIVENGGNAQMVAGHKITLLPGTKGNHGSYLHAYISRNGAYCCNYIPPVKAASDVASIIDLLVVDKSFFKVYPNPTSGTFTLELNGIKDGSKVSVEIYGILGERILKSDLYGSKQHVFDLSAKQHGIYLIRVMSGDETGMTKIIKQ